MRAVTNPRLDSMLQLIQAAASLFLGLFFNWLFILPSNYIIWMEARKKEWKKEMINTYENQDIEFKQEYVSDINKEVIAFVNADGGTILIGARNNGEVCGVDNPDFTIQQVTNSLRDTVSPDVIPFVKVKTIQIEEKNVIEILISTGTNRPYYIREKGLRPSGVYIRKGSSSQPVSDAGIREMIILNSGITYESCRSIEQNLSFDALEHKMTEKNLKFGKPQMQTLKLIGDDKLYTNLALILSDQCKVTTKVALFQGRDKKVLRERREFEGSIIKQLNDVYQFLDLCNKTKASFNGLDRSDLIDYPKEALRETLLNCIVHRDYSLSGSTIINIYDDRMEFISLGGLVSGLSIDDIFLGASLTRNTNLAILLYRIGLIESCGLGIGRIMEGYDGFNQKPVFETAQGVFRVTLPNRNEIAKTVNATPNRKKTINRSDEKDMIIQYVSDNGFISRRETESLINAGSSKSAQILSELVDEGRLTVSGSGNKVRYIKE